ncbi:putative transcription factor interactor and regulator CCHC(Zn) family [Rosa chinensis]|uniref:Putative transcription factor interactor and regulator CCHC(Zn) family n=1 Tax=Rosa chinensis TaxID=74649 RepID=A0A2P6SCA6_ROSCH|nr:putative transcription factor interactor and regulator CCHC(Zn) family [Rosa chinensis]
MQIRLSFYVLIFFFHPFLLRVHGINHEFNYFTLITLGYGVRFKGTLDKVRKWRDALIKASKIAGFVSRNIGPDYKLVEEVVRDIVWKLSRKCIAPQDVGEDVCFKCGGIGHWAQHCPSAGECFKCGGIGHWAQHCPSAGECFKCGGLGHWAQHCPSRFNSDEDM